MQYNPYAYAGLPMQPAQTLYQQPYMAMPQMMPQQPVPAPLQQSQVQQNQAQQPAEPLDNGGLIIVPTEEDVKKYSVAPGHLVTFRLANQPIIIEKSMSRSQFAEPLYVRYRLQKENMDGTPSAEEAPAASDGMADELNAIRKCLEHIDVQIDILKDNYSEMARSIKTGRKVKEEAEK